MRSIVAEQASQPHATRETELERELRQAREENAALRRVLMGVRP